MMIDEVKEEGELPIGKDYKELFVSKGADGRLLIHQGLLQYMLKHADRKNLYYCMLDEYLSSLLDLENEPEFDDCEGRKIQSWCIYRILLWSNV